MRVSVDAVLAYYRTVYDKTFRNLPIVNTALLPGTDRWDERPQGSACTVKLPGGKVDFRVSHEEQMGTTLSAGLFSTVADFPDQAVAREVAQETLRLLFDGDGMSRADEPGRRMSRRALLRRLGGVEEDSRDGLA